MPAKSKKDTLGSLLLNHALAAVFFVLFPAFVTAVAPVSWITFTRENERVTTEAHTCTLFFIPYRTQRVEDVTGLGDRFIAGKVEKRRLDRNHPGTRSEDEGFLVIHGPETSIEVPVSPASISHVLERSQAFLDDPAARELRLFVVANWKFSIFAGGIVSLLTVLYVVGMTLSFVNYLAWLAGFRETLPPTFHDPSADDTSPPM